MAHHIHTGQFGNVDVVDAVQNVDRRTQTGSGTTRKIDLGDVAGDDDLRSESQSGEEHFHLLGGGVLCLVEDDKSVIEGVVRQQEVFGDVQRIGGRDLDTHGFLGASGFDAVDEAHYPPTARCVVLRGLAGEAEWDDVGRQTDVEQVCVRLAIDDTAE